MARQSPTVAALAKLIVQIADRGKVLLAALKKAGISLPSDSGVEWTDFAERFGLAKQLENARLEKIIIPMFHLPPSIHEIMFEEAWHTQDVYQERHVQRIERGSARFRIMDPYLVRIIGLFQGRVIDKPEQDTLETEYACGGNVDHEISMLGGILFVIVEFELDMSLEDNVAQLFVEILAAAKANEKMDFYNRRVYGLLTDAFIFRFYSFNPLANKFAYDDNPIVNITRNYAFTDMIPVSNKIFSVVLAAYIDGLEASLLKSKERTSQANIRRGWISTDKWETALQLAEQCCRKFNEPVDTIEEMEERSTAALELLASSVRSIPRVSCLTGSDDPSSVEEVRDLAHHMVHEKHVEVLQPNQ
ncbi:hypothetical protein D9615_003421 [Tricholomella constricta]|uniref:Uncharacterized protein n=1 Tax=Tricholomella constricta TaxID=117010 RepID=A0A8H5HIS1_9AGAR|nr:hypothetical protein D9615_003421 [Tricholomella constricta]